MGRGVAGNDGTHSNHNGDGRSAVDSEILPPHRRDVVNRMKVVPTLITPSVPFDLLHRKIIRSELPQSLDNHWTVKHDASFIIILPRL